MKATGIAVILAQAGAFVPATSMCLRPYDAAFSRIWNRDNIWTGLSSFAVEMTELRDILELSTASSLVLGDEVCSGTESASATALVAATLEHLDEKGTHFMFATHLHDLLKVPRLFPRPGISVWHLHVSTLNGKLIYDRSLQPGSGSSSYGLEVARAMGIPSELMSRAYDIRRDIIGHSSTETAPKSSWNSEIQRVMCETCGERVIRDLEVHHIQERVNGGNNHVRNLAVLCEKCHDKIHAKELTITPFTQTSEGLERLSQDSSEHEPGPESLKKFAYKKAPKGRSLEQINIIRSTMLELKGRPLARIATELQIKHGIIITVPQIKQLT